MAERKSKPVEYGGLGKLPPQAIELEEAVLGALMLEKQQEYIFALVKPEIFYKDSHQKLCRAIIELRQARSPIDILTVTAKCRNNGDLDEIGGAYYITQLTDRVASSANIEYHLLIVTQKYLQRELIRITNEAQQRCYDDGADPFDEMAKLVRQIDKLKKAIFKRSERNMKDLLLELRMDREMSDENGLIGLSSGKRGLDSITEGHQPNMLVIKAARPGMGKTADACSEMLNCCFDSKTQEPLKNQIPVGCFSLEMSGKSLAHRMLSNLSSIPAKKIKKNNLTPDEKIRIDEYEEKLSNAPIIIDDTAGLTIDEFETKAALWVAIYDVRKIYIDYLQLMLGSPSVKYQSREAEISDISRRLKRVAKELEITVVALCQLSREVEKRHLNIPILSDLRESGSIEQDADVVELLWRPEYYPEVMKELSKPGGSIDVKLFNLSITDFKDLIITIVAKCREEETGKVPHRFKADIMRVHDHPQVLDFLNSKNEIFTPQASEKDAPF